MFKNARNEFPLRFTIDHVIPRSAYGSGSGDGYGDGYGDGDGYGENKNLAALLWGVKI